MATATNSQVKSATAPKATAPKGKGYDSVKPDTTHVDQATEVKPTQADLDNLITDINAAIEYGQGILNSALGYEWKSAAKKGIKSIAEAHASLFNYRDSATFENLSEVVTSVESTLEAIDTAFNAVKDAKATESELAALKVLHGDGYLLVNGEEYLIPSEGVAIVRYVRQTKQGNLSVLFMSPTQGSALLPIGLITPDTVKRFSDVRLSPEIQKAIAMAKGKFCEAYKTAIKAEKLSQKEQDNARRFESAGFSRI